MGYDYSKKLSAVGQPDDMGCWYTSISWWTRAMALNCKRRAFDPLEIYAMFKDKVGDGWNANQGSMPKSVLKDIGSSAVLRITFEFIPANTFRDYEDIDSPLIIVFRYPAVKGGTHMNVLFNQQGNMVTAMEPYYPADAPDGTRTGNYIKRPMSFFTSSAEVGVGYASMADSDMDQ